MTTGAGTAAGTPPDAEGAPRRPAALAYSTANCTIGRALDILADRRTFLVLREVFLGVRRFADIRERTGMPRQVLADRLAGLVAEGLLRRHAYRQPGHRGREEYRLTDRGLHLYPVLLALREWGDRYLADPQGPPVGFAHAGCGGDVRLVARCTAGHELTDPREVVPVPGPGALPH